MEMMVLPALATTILLFGFVLGYGTRDAISRRRRRRYGRG
jgi:hypothetical protein